MDAAPNALLDRIGNTPLRLLDGIYVKLECANPGGSIKDRIGQFLLEEAARRGELNPGDTVVETTSGNTGIALSMVARRLGYRVIIYMPEHMSIERRKMLEALGADVRLTPREESFAGAVRRRDEHRGTPGFYIPDQFSNPDNSRCHRLTTGAEILRQLAELGVEEVDAFVAGVGTGGTLMGVGEALRAKMPKLRLVAVEPEESAVMSGGAAGEHGIQGIGDGFVPALVDPGAIDEVQQVSTAAATAEAQRLHREHGFCVGISSGSNTIVARRLQCEGLRVVTVWPDCSDRYLSLGLDPPGSLATTCADRARCGDRMQQIRS